MCVRVCVCVCVCVCARARMCACMCMCVGVGVIRNIYIHVLVPSRRMGEVPLILVVGGVHRDESY